MRYLRGGCPLWVFLLAAVVLAGGWRVYDYCRYQNTIPLEDRKPIHYVNTTSLLRNGAATREARWGAAATQRRPSLPGVGTDPKKREALRLKAEQDRYNVNRWREAEGQQDKGKD